MSKFTLDDALALEDEGDAIAIQRAINAHSWGFQGSYGRTMMDAINAGRAMLGLTDCRDAYGNHVPSRSQVQAGTKGSREFVVEHSGEDYAAKLETA